MHNCACGYEWAITSHIAVSTPPFVREWYKFDCTDRLTDLSAIFSGLAISASVARNGRY